MAEFLDIPHVAYVRKISSVTENSITVERLMEEGYDIVESSLPCLITVVKELNEPRLPSLRGKMAASKAEIKKMGLSDIEVEESLVGLKGSPTQVKRIFAPELKKTKKVFDGTPEEQVDKLLMELRRLQCV